jgi:hypothetical protein
MNDTDNKIAALLPQWGITFGARYVGETVLDNDWQCDAWRVKFAGFETDYFMGLGNRNKKTGRPVAPTAASVLYSLVSDSNALYSSFKHWCDDYGYDSDSIKAFDTYRACCEIGEKLAKVFTRVQMNELRELLQDY